MAHERNCIVCGKKYSYCPKCGGKDNPNELWRNIYCSNNCMSVSKIWDECRSDKITNNEALLMIKKLPDYEILNIEQYRPYMQPVMKDILGESVEPLVTSDIVVEPAIEETTVESIDITLPSVEETTATDSDVNKDNVTYRRKRRKI